MDDHDPDKTVFPKTGNGYILGNRSQTEGHRPIFAAFSAKIGPAPMNGYFRRKQTPLVCPSAGISARVAQRRLFHRKQTPFVRFAGREWRVFL